MSEHLDTAPQALVLDRASPLPLWAQLLADLRRRVGSGELAAGFPSELELAAAYGVSRGTVREATRRLRADGTVVAGRGRRPQLGRQIRQPLGAFYSLFGAVRAAGLEQASVVRALQMRIDDEAASRLGLPAGSAVLHVERLRMAGGEPLALDRIDLPAELGSALLESDLERRSLYDELARLTGIRLQGGEEHIAAVVPGRAERRLLEIPAGVACFDIERTGRAGGAVVEWRRTLVRADRFSVVAEFSVPAPSTAGNGDDLLAAAGSIPQQR